MPAGGKNEEKPGLPKPTAARFALASNLKHLMDNYPMGFLRGITPPKLAAGCKLQGLELSVKTIRRMLNPYDDVSPNLDSIDAAAAFFKVTTWDMLQPRQLGQPRMQVQEPPIVDVRKKRQNR